MLSRLEVILEKPKQDLDVNCSSLFQGVIMELIDSEYAEEMHLGGLNPYSQHIKVAMESIKWTITGLNEAAYERMIRPIYETMQDSINIEHKNLKLKIISKKIEKKPLEDLMNDTFFSECLPWITIKFTTPTAFKVNGFYQFYPTVNHVFGSLMRRYDSISEDSKMFSEEVLTQIDSHVKIAKYNLKSTQFHLEGVKIPAFTGNVTFKVNGPKQLVNLLNMLTEFGEFSGVGIKTSIGMGAIEKQ